MRLRFARRQDQAGVTPTPVHMNGETLADAWNANVGGPDGCLRDTAAYEVYRGHHGCRLVVHVPDDSDTVAALRTRLDDVAAALNLDVSQLWVDEQIMHTVCVAINDGHVMRTQLRFAPHELITGERGRLPFGDLLHGERRAEWVLSYDNLTCSGVIVDPTASDATGVTGMLDVLVLGARAQGAKTVVIDHDGARWSRELLAVVDDRLTDGPEDLAQRLRSFRQESDAPMVVVLIDRADRYFADAGIEVCDQWAELVPVLERSGIAVIAQVNDLGIASFGGSKLLRAALTHHNVVVLGEADEASVDLVPVLRRPTDGAARISPNLGRQVCRAETASEIAVRQHRGLVAKASPYLALGITQFPFRIFEVDWRASDQ